MENKKHYETELPDSYHEVKHINALDKKLGLILNIISVAVAVCFVFLALFIVGDKPLFPKDNPLLIVITAIVFGVSVMLYMVLHELVHGVAYKLTTRNKLTFGMSWSCAFCGVPDIYVYRGASVFALASPLVLFTLVLVPLCCWMYFVAPVAFLASALLLGFHIGGCSGDIYMLMLLVFKYRDKGLLIRDTGPEQYIYSKKV